MASTRNKNTIGNYQLQQKGINLIDNYNSYLYSSRPTQNKIPCLGFNPSYMPREALSKNSIDIETNLFGINSTNLVENKEQVNPQLIQNDSVTFFNRLPLIMPNDYKISDNQRPLRN